MSKEKTRQINVLVDVSLITCVVERGQADKIVQAAKAVGAQGATIYYARGLGVKERLGLIGVAVNAEKEVIEIIVSDEQADRVFEAMYLAGDLDTPGRGIITLSRLDKAATYIPPEVLQKLETNDEYQS